MRIEMPANIRRGEIVEGLERFARALAHNLEEMDKDQPTNRYSFALPTNISYQLQKDRKDGLFASGSSATLAQSISARLGSSIPFLASDCLNCSLMSSIVGCV